MQDSIKKQLNLRFLGPDSQNLPTILKQASHLTWEFSGWMKIELIPSLIRKYQTNMKIIIEFSSLILKERIKWYRYGFKIPLLETRLRAVCFLQELLEQMQLLHIPQIWYFNPRHRKNKLNYLTHENEHKCKFALQWRAWGINYETYTDNFLWVNNPIVVFASVHSKSTCRKNSIEDLGIIIVRSIVRILE